MGIISVSWLILGVLGLKKSAIDILVSLGLAKLELQGLKEIIGVGGKTTCTNGIYSFLLPLKDGYIATFTGVCLEKVTATFPTYPLEDVEVEVGTFVSSKVETIC